METHDDDDMSLNSFHKTFLDELLKFLLKFYGHRFCKAIYLHQTLHNHYYNPPNTYINVNRVVGHTIPPNEANIIHTIHGGRIISSIQF